MSTRHVSLSNTRTASSPAVSPLQNPTRVSFTPHTKPPPIPTISIAKGTGTEPPRSVTIDKTPRSSSRGTKSSLSSSNSSRNAPPPVPRPSNSNRRHTNVQNPQHKQQSPSGPTAEHPSLFVPPANYYRMERPRPIKQVSAGPNQGHYYTLRGKPILELPELPRIPNTPVFAGTGFGEGSEGRSPLVNPPRSAGQDSGWGSEVLDGDGDGDGDGDFEIHVIPPDSVEEQKRGGDIGDKSYAGYGMTGHEGLYKDGVDTSGHLGGLYPEGQLSLASLLIATGQSHRQLNHSTGSLLSPSNPPYPSLLPPPHNYTSPTQSPHNPHITHHLHLSTQTNHLLTSLLSSLHHLRQEIPHITPSSSQRYTAFNRLEQHKQQLIQLEAKIQQVGASFEGLVREGRLKGVHEGVGRMLEENVDMLRKEGREVRGAWELARGEWEEMAAGEARAGGWWAGWMARGCCGGV